MNELQILKQDFQLTIQNLPKEQVIIIQELLQNKEMTDLFNLNISSSDLLCAVLDLEDGLTVAKCRDCVSVPLARKIARNLPENQKAFLDNFLNNALVLNLQKKNIEPNEVVLYSSLQRLNDLNGGWTLQDIVLMLKMGVSGGFGKNYNTFDVETLERWIDGYYVLKSNAIEINRAKAKQEFDKPQKGNPELKNKVANLFLNQSK